ncbi:hypothetical protein TrST_g7383 [Triparma strigata]|uniref:Uncharacterized protein n=1 Tax=Triparma strigata TaxID=1606541 RepID=A0A9W7E915_9STRA|nr:hypothetical protein TrST_g7383 [Triparma strigata]
MFGNNPLGNNPLLSDEDDDVPSQHIEISGMITSEEHFYDSRALPDPAAAPPQTADFVASQAWLAAEAKFQERLHQKFFSSDEEDYAEEAQKRRQHLLANNICNADDVLELTTSTTKHRVSFLAAATNCDLCYNAATSKIGTAQTHTLSLHQFSSSSIESFCNILASYDSLLTQESPLPKTCDCAAKEATEPNVDPENVLETLEVMHYLQSTVLLHSLSKFVEDKVDSSNAGSILMLSDRLQLPNLFEASVSHMTSSLDDIKKDECWDDFPTHLQNRLLTLRAAVSSSILGRGTKSKVFFSSAEEFLAIFSDNLRDQRERLREAKQRQAEVLVESRGKSASASDAANKIERQVSRIAVLQTFYTEQVQMFRNLSTEKTENHKPLVL